MEKELDNERRKQLGSIDAKRKLENQLQDSEQQLDMANRAYRKLEKRFSTIAAVIEDERRISEQSKAELDRANNRNKSLKRQVEELEEEMARLNAKIRKCNRELEDLNETNETLAKENQLLRNRNKTYSRIESRTTRAVMQSRLTSDWNRGSTDALNMTDGSAGSRDGSIADDSVALPANGDDRKSLDGLP
uniref:Myosin tail domain-containing protein n=1 Tax=Romanomermis culicivorax TaxID=13658 RepID=A0A915KIZ5_ROMCU